MVLSIWDFRSAAEYATLLIDILIRRSVSHAVPQALINALHTALVVTYARPFSANRADEQTAATISLRALFKMSAEQRRLHQGLLQLRNRALAHSDPSSWQVEFREEPRKAVPVVMHPVVSPTVAELTAVRELCRQIEEALSRRLARCGYPKLIFEQVVEQG